MPKPNDQNLWLMCSAAALRCSNVAQSSSTLDDHFYQSPKWPFNKEDPTLVIVDKQNQFELLLSYVFVSIKHKGLCNI